MPLVLLDRSVAAACWSRRAPNDQVGRIEGLLSIAGQSIRPSAPQPGERMAGRRSIPTHRPNETEIERMRRESRDEGMGKQV